MSAPQGIYSGEFFENLGVAKHSDTRYVATGEFRAPRKGEHYLSGALIQAWRALNDLSQEFWIARAVKIEPCKCCKGTGKVVVK